MLILRRFIAIFLMVGVVSNCFNYLLLQEGYEFNKAYIASVLCSNKEKVHLHCDGKCFLDIKLKELEQKNKQEQENLKRSIETFTQHVVVLPTPISEEIVIEHTTLFGADKPVTRSISIFQPPRLA